MNRTILSGSGGHIRQFVQDEAVECEDRAFLLSTVNLFGKNVWDPKEDCEDTQVDIFRDAEARMKKLPGALSASWWWLRSAYNYSDFYGVTYSGDWSYYNAYFAGGVAVGFCIEAKS